MGAVVTGRFLALGHDFAVEADDHRIARQLEALLAALARPGRAATRYEVRDRGETAARRWVVRFEGRHVVASPRAEHAVATLLWHVNQEAVRSCDRHVVLHAGAVALGERGVLLPGPMEAGKSTLVAGLVRGGLDYLTDEAVAVGLDDGAMWPFPKPLGLDAGSVRLFPHLAPAVGAEPPHGPQRHIPLSLLGGRVAPGPVRPALMVFPRYLPGAPLVMAPLHPADALVLACKNAFNLGRTGRAGFARLAALARSVPAFSLTSGDLHASVAAVTGALESIP